MKSRTIYPIKFRSESGRAVILDTIFEDEDLTTTFHSLPDDELKNDLDLDELLHGDEWLEDDCEALDIPFLQRQAF